MSFAPGQVYQSSEFPDHVWLVVEVDEAEGTLRVAFLSVREELCRHEYEPGVQMRFTLAEARNSKCQRIA